MQMINTFWQELQESWEQIKEFYKKTKVLRWFGACLMFYHRGCLLCGKNDVCIVWNPVRAGRIFC